MFYYSIYTLPHYQGASISLFQISCQFFLPLYRPLLAVMWGKICQRVSVFMPICHFPALAHRLCCPLAAGSRLCVYLSIILKFNVSPYSFGNFALSLLQILFSVLYRRLYILLCVLVASAVLCEAQTIALPDTLFGATDSDGTTDAQELPSLDMPSFTFEEPLFKVAPAVTVEDYLTAPTYSDSFFQYFPEQPSEFFLHVLLLHLSNIDIPGLDAELARHRLMLDNFNRNLYEGGGYTIPYVPAIVSDVTTIAHSFAAGGGMVVYNGYLDPLEAYRRWVQERRLLRARAIVRQLEDGTLPTKEELKSKKLDIAPNLMQMNDDSYDVKVKSDGDNPPYRP